MTGRRRPRLSQHFLHDAGIAARIADALRAPPGARVLEIGPGRGALTEHLLERGWRVRAIEIDHALAADLRDRWGERDGFEVIEGDALEISLPVGEDPWWVIGNLPYAITSPLLFRLLEAVPETPIREIVCMIQKEVADRLVAEPGTGEIGSLTVGIRLVADVERLFDVGSGAFRPPPTVRSSVVRIVPHDRHGLEPARVERIRHLVQTVFGQRRKQLQKSLRTLEPWSLTHAEADRVAERAGLDLTRRPETLSVEEWLRLDDAVSDVAGRGRADSP